MGITKKIENAVVHKNTNNPSNWPFRCTDIAPRSRNSSPAQSCCCDLELTALCRSLFSIIDEGKKAFKGGYLLVCLEREREREVCPLFLSLSSFSWGSDKSWVAKSCITRHQIELGADCRLQWIYTTLPLFWMGEPCNSWYQIVETEWEHFSLCNWLVSLLGKNII